MLHVLTVIAFVLPLSIDTFVLSTALGAAGMPPTERLRTSLVLSSFEGVMPVVGFLLGAAIGSVVGEIGGWAGAVVLAAVGLWMLRPGSEEAEESEERRVKLLRTAQGWTVIALGLSISVDEFAVGLGAGLLGLALVALVAIIIVQAFLAAQVGLRIGSRLAEESREVAEKIAGGLLVLAAALVVVEKLVGGS